LRERLPHVANVSKYELTIFPHFPFLGLYRQHPDFTFDGTVKIHFTLTNDTQFIWLFAQNLLEFKSVKLTTSKGSIPLSFFNINPNTTRLTVKTVTQLKHGQECTLSKCPLCNTNRYFLVIKYRGPINEYGDAGLYYSKYTDEDGDIRYLVGTFFEPMRARKMYPGFDDPFFKAVFQ
jgi:aminopeptidase N